MAKQLLFQFWVKPSGIFASKRYANVFVDTDNGSITQEPVPGKEIINLNFLSDYKSNNYPYEEGQEITRFCNTETFTQYRILAKRSKDWAITQTDLNEPLCGYLQPLPTPAVPPNPFGVAPYAVYAFLNYCDINNIAKTANIYKRNFTGDAIEIDNGDKSPIKFIYTAGDDKFTKIRAQECEFSFIAKENFELENIYTSDEREYRLEVIDVATNTVDFSGFIIPDNSEEPFAPPPYPVTIRATDGLGALKTITYPIPVGSSTDIRQKFIDIIAFALAKTNLNLDIMTMVNIYAIGMANGLNDDPLEQASVSPLRMTNTSGDIYTCFEALEAVCAEFGASIQQVNGQWRFARINELAKGTGRYRLYDYTARFKFAGTLATLRNLGKNTQDVVLLGGASSSINPPYKLVKVLLDYGDPPDIIFNGDFEQWDGQNFNYWTRYGSLDITRIRKEVIASNGVKIPLDDYACQFNQKANSAKWLEGNQIFMNKGQSARLSLNIGHTDGFYLLSTRIKSGQYYLTNFNGKFEWVTQLATIKTAVNNVSGSISTFAISIEIPEIPVSGNVIIQFYGFTHVNPVYGGTVVMENGVITSAPTPVVVRYDEINTYTPIAIDNISIKSTISDDNRVKGALNVASQNGFYTNKPDQIEIIWGELGEGSLDPSTVTGSLQPAYAKDVIFQQSQLQTIFIPDGSTAKGWYEFGESSSPVTIGLCLARAILKAYQTPYKVMDVEVMGSNLSYFDTFNIIVAGQPEFSSKIFMWQDVEFDQKYNTARGTLVEIFSKAIISNDYTTPDLGGTGHGDLPIVQNPNPPIKINGIFTEQFTPEYR